MNLSARRLNNTEISLLERGLKFTPTPRNPYTQELTKDILEFTRKVHSVEYFDGIKDNDESLVRNKTNFVPPHGREELLDSFVKSTVPTEKSNIRRNLSIPEQKSISQLANDDNIIIKQTDKKGATVIMERLFYQQQIL